MSNETQPAPEEASDGLTQGSTKEPAAEMEQTVRVSRRVDADVTDVWQHLVSPAGQAALFGAGAELGTKGESWRSHDGPHGVLRSYHPLEQVRVSWHADDDGPASLVDLHLVPDGDATRVDIVHERLTSTDPHPDLEGHWQSALDRFASGVG